MYDIRVTLKLCSSGYCNINRIFVFYRIHGDVIFSLKIINQNPPAKYLHYSLGHLLYHIVRIWCILTRMCVAKPVQKVNNDHVAWRRNKIIIELVRGECRLHDRYKYVTIFISGMPAYKYWDTHFCMYKYLANLIPWKKKGYSV